MAKKRPHEKKPGKKAMVLLAVDFPLQICWRGAGMPPELPKAVPIEWISCKKAE